MAGGGRTLATSPRTVLLAIGLAVAVASPAGAALRTWSGGSAAGGNWTTSANWLGGTAPSAGDSLVFPAGAARLSNTNTFAANTVFAAISVSGVGYSIRGNAVTLTGGISGDFAGSSSTFNPDIRLSGSQVFSASVAGGVFILGGDVELGANNLGLSCSGVLTLAGAVSGSGAVTKVGAGRAEYVGVVANTYTGRTTVNQGVLLLSKFLGGGLVSIPGELVIGDGMGGDDADVVQLQSSDQIANSAAVIVNSSGLLALNGWSDAIGALQMTSGHLDTGTGTLTLGGDVAVLGGGTSLVDGRVSLAGGAHLVDTPGSSLLRVNAVLSGSGGLTKTGTGYLNLYGANTFSGNLVVQGGLVDIQHDGALGTAAGSTLLTAGILRLNGSIVAGESLTVGGGKFQALGATNAWTGPVSLANLPTIEVTSDGQVLNLTGVVSGTGGFVKTGAGTLVLSGASGNSFAGDVAVNGGVLLLDKLSVDGALPGPGALVIGDGLGGDQVDVVREARDYQIDSSVDITINDSGLLDLNNRSDAVGTLDLVGGWVTTGSGALTLGGDVSATSTSNQTARIYGRVAWAAVTRTFEVRPGWILPEMRLLATAVSSGSLRKTGAGWFGLSRSNAYTGLTTVAEGTLVVEDDWALGATNSGTMVGAGASLALAGVHVGNEALTFDESVSIPSTFTAALVLYSNSWAGPISIPSPLRLSVPNGSMYLNLAGPITGTGGLVKSGSGTLILSGNSGNTYSGDTEVLEGTLELAKVTGGGAAIRYGSLRIGDGTGGDSADKVAYRANDQLWSTVPISIESSGRLDLNGFADTVGPITFSGGRATSGSGGLLYLGGNVTTVGGTGSLEGRVELLVTRTFNVSEAAGADLSVSAQVTGPGGITKTGPGHLYLGNANTYQGLTTVNEGLVYVDDDNALGSTAGGTVVNAGAGIVLRSGANVGTEALTLNGAGQAPLGALASIYGSNSWAGPITLASDVRMTTLQGIDVLQLSGAIAGATSGLTLEGGGTVMFAGSDPNSFGGATRVNSGTLVLAKSGANRAIAGDLVIGDGLGGAENDVVRLELSTQISNSSGVTVASSGLLDLNDFGEAIDGLTGSGRIHLGSGYLNVGAGGGASTFDGVIRGSGSVTKLGAGTMTFTGNNTYTGTTSVGSGRLHVNGSQPASTVIVAASATLGGGGTVGAVTSTGGSVSPGASPGRLHTGNLQLDAASTFVAELAGDTPGSLYDQLTVVGTVNLGGATLSVDAAGFMPTAGEVYTLIENDGADAVVGSFAGLPNGSPLAIGSRQYRIYYTGGSGNDVILAPVNIPVLVEAVTVAAGNANGVIEPNECDDLALRLYNADTNAVTGIEVTLSSLTLGVTVTHARLAFPDIPALASRSNTRMFQLSTSPFLVCGTMLDFMLTVQTSSHGSFKVPFRVPGGSPGAPVTFNSADTPMAILDAATVTSTVIVSGVTAPLSKVVVSLYATHANLADLDISLVSPDGTTIPLTTDNGGSTDSYGSGCGASARTVFDSEALTTIVSGSSPYVGSYRPEGSLQVLRGLTGSAVNGTWALRVADDSPGNTGALNCWTLTLYPASCVPGSGPCLLCGDDTTVTGTIAISDPDGYRLLQNGVASSCGSTKPCPGSAGGSSEFHAYSFYSGPTGTCVTVTLESPCPSTNALSSAAYLGAYNPLLVCTGYLGDSGSGAWVGTSRTYSFQVPGKTNFWVVVQMVTDNAPCAEYALTVSGADCRPTLSIAKATGLQVLVRWPTYASGYRLQSTNRLDSAPNAFSPVNPYPLVVLDSWYAVTNTATGTRFFRLVK